MKFAVLLILSWIFVTVLSWTNYRLFFRALKVDYLNKDYMDIHEFKVQSLNRSFSYIIFNATLLKTATDVKVNGQFFKMQSNMYKEQFLPISGDVCSIIAGKGTISQNALSRAYFSALGKVFRNIINANGIKFPKGCPICPQKLYVEYHLDEDVMPNFFLPQGKWRTSILFEDGNTSVVKYTLHFEIIEYASEKQKKKFG